MDFLFYICAFKSYILQVPETPEGIQLMSTLASTAKNQRPLTVNVDGYNTTENENKTPP